ncbi:MAG: beta-ketoacyl-ACP synthase II [Elusimicrobiota bacterium]|nr:beta-ketoacyl-ACP synthase II [Endomicrobiia bacterium]MDW8165795.1 beta-ketoacyl-ACP synthase II [Elusimicrobiota bacterium]
MEKKKVVITGMGIISPIGIGKEEFTYSLRHGKSGVGRITLFDASDFPTTIAAEVKNFNPEDYIDKKKVRRMDRFCQFAVAAAKMAIEDAGLNLEKEDLSRIGVIIGSGIGGISTIEAEMKVLLTKGHSKISPFLIPMEIINIAAGEIAIQYGFLGPNYGVTSACASSNHAIGDALRILRYGDADVIIAGGSEAAITPLGLAGFSSARALSRRNDEPQKASRPFDKNRDGFVMGEGACMFVLETLEHAIKRNAKIYAELAGYAATDDAYHITAPREDGSTQALCMELALKDAGVTIDEVDYINAHGTSTPLNDKCETLAIKNVFKERAYKIDISSTKSMTGHLLGAAGAVELAAILVCMENDFIHPTINYEEPDPECDLNYTPNVAKEKRINVSISNSFGFGGHNAVLVVKRYNL